MLVPAGAAAGRERVAGAALPNLNPDVVPVDDLQELTVFGPVPGLAVPLEVLALVVPRRDRGERRAPIHRWQVPQVEDDGLSGGLPRELAGG